MPKLEFHPIALLVRDESQRGAEPRRLAAVHIPGSVRRTPQWFQPRSEAILDKGTAIVEFHRHLSTIVFRHPDSVAPSVAPDIVQQIGVSQNSSNRPLPIEIARELPLGPGTCALVRAGDIPDRFFVLPFTALDEAVTPIAPSELAEKFSAAREAGYPHALCSAIGEAMTHEIFFGAIPHVLPPRSS